MRVRFAATLLPLALAGLLGLSGEASAATQAWRVAGEGAYSGFALGFAKPRGHHAYSFVVTVAPPLWNIRTREPGGQEDYWETGTDGRRVFHLMSVKTRAERRRREGQPIQNDNVGSVATESVPRVQDLFHTTLWMAFAAGDYFAAKKEPTIEMLFPGGMNSPELLRLGGYSQGAAWRLSTGAVALVTMVTGMDDGRMRYWETLGETLALPPETRRWPGPFGHGFTNFEYTATRYTNAYGQQWPVAGRFLWWTPTANRRKPALQVTQRCEFEAHSIERLPSAPATFVPAIDGPTLVGDNRFMTEPSPTDTIVYMATNRWPSDDEVRASAAYAAQVRKQARFVAHAKHEAAYKGAVRRVTVLMLLLSPALVAYWALRVQRQRSTA